MSTADSVVEFRVVHRHPGLVIGQGYRRIGRGASMQLKLDLRRKGSLMRGKHARLTKSKTVRAGDSAKARRRIRMASDVRGAHGAARNGRLHIDKCA